MISGRTLAWFILRLVLIEAILIFPWFGDRRDLGVLYRQAFIFGNNLAFATLGSQRTVRFQAMDPPLGSLDAEVTLHNVATGDLGTMLISSRQFGWLPTSFLLALIAASPGPFIRKSWPFVWAMLCITLLVLVRVLISILVNFSEGSNPNLVHLSAPARSALAHIDGALNVPMVGWFVLPLIVWIAVGLRAQDWVPPDGAAGAGR